MWKDRSWTATITRLSRVKTIIYHIMVAETSCRHWNCLAMRCHAKGPTRRAILLQSPVLVRISCQSECVKRSPLVRMEAAIVLVHKETRIVLASFQTKMATGLAVRPCKKVLFLGKRSPRHRMVWKMPGLEMTPPIPSWKVMLQRGKMEFPMETSLRGRIRMAVEARMTALMATTSCSAAAKTCLF